MGSHSATVDRLATGYLGDRNGLEAITRAELVRRPAMSVANPIVDERARRLGVAVIDGGPWDRATATGLTLDTT